MKLRGGDSKDAGNGVTPQIALQSDLKMHYPSLSIDPKHTSLTFQGISPGEA